MYILSARDMAHVTLGAPVLGIAPASQPDGHRVAGWPCFASPATSYMLSCCSPRGELGRGVQERVYRSTGGTCAQQRGCCVC